MRDLRLVVVCVVAACGGGGSGHPDAAGGDDDAPAIDAPGDALADAPIDAPQGSPLILNDGVHSIPEWTAPAIYTGGTSGTRLFVYNPGSTMVGAFTASFTGPDAASFSVQTTGTTCAGALVPGDGCWLRVQFTNAAAGARSATLVLSDGTGPVGSFLIHGTASILSGGGLVANVVSVDFGDTARGLTPTASVIITNSSTSTITPGARTAAAPYAVVSDNCPATLTAGASCTVNLKMTPSALGTQTGTLHIPSDANTLDVPLTAVVLRTIRVTEVGFGSGSVGSLPAGLSCTGTCQALFPGGITVTLVPTPASSNMFVQWEGLCHGGTCSIVTPVEGTANARFVPTSAHKIAITAAGTGVSYGAATTDNGLTSYGACAGSCDIYVPDASQITMYGSSPSAFQGWSGDCTATTATCNLGTVTADRAVTITSNKDTDEVATLLPPTGVKGVAVMSNGDVVISDTNGAVTRMTAAGATVWSTVVAGAASLVVDGADNVYGIGGGGVFSLTSAGAARWTRSATLPSTGGFFNGALGVSPDGTVVAVLTSDGVWATDGSGTDRFTITGISPAPAAVAVAADHTVGVVASYDIPPGAGNRQVLRYTPAGVALASLAPIPGDGRGPLAFDASGSAAMVVTGQNQITTSSTTSANAAVFNSVETTGSGGSIPAGVAVASNADIIEARYLKLTGTAGARLRVFTSAGASVFTLTKTPGTAILPFVDGVAPSSVAAGGAKRFAVAGTYAGNGWVEIFDLP